MACSEMYVVNNLCSCYISTCSKKFPSVIIIRIKTLFRATFKNWVFLQVPESFVFLVTWD